MKAGFDWYRAFSQDVQDNAVPATADGSLLYLRGDHETGDIAESVAGAHAAGVQRLEHGLAAEAGHFAPEEAPEATWRLIAGFLEGDRPG